MNPTLVRTARALGSGLVGAATVNALNESARRFLPRAPHLQTLGTRALARGYRLAGRRPPGDRRLYWLALAGDLAANTLFYGLVEPGRRPHRWVRGVLLGTAAGLGSVQVPPRTGLGSFPTRRTEATKGMTVLWYLAGGLASAAIASLLARRAPVPA